MSEDNNTETQAGTAVALRPQRQLVADVVPIFDSARFEHYGRIAAVMAQSTLVPETLRKGTREEAIANCIQVVEFADRANFSPFAVAQCASVLYGKLMFEGKLVDAMLQTKLKIELNCYYKGTRGKGDRRIYVTDATLTEDQFNLLEPGEYPFGIKMIDGSIDEWKTFEKNGTAVMKAWTGQQSEMQLGYKGKRTWSRMFRPAVMLGVITDDEVDSFDERRLEAPQQTASFADAPKPARKPRKAADAAASNPTGEPEEGLHARQEGGGEAENVQDAEFEDNAAEDRPTTGAADTATDGARPAEDTQGSSGSVSTAPEASQGQTASSQTEASERTERGSVAPRDAVYRLTTDEPNADGKLPTYKNGKAFSSVKPDAKVLPPEFDVHAPEAAPAAEENEHQEEQPAGAFDDNTAPDVVSETITAIRAAETFVAGEEAMKALAASPGFKDKVTDDRKAGVRLALWTRYGELLEDGLEGIEAHENFTLMRLFLEFGAKTQADIDGQWTPFWRSTYRAQNEGNQRAITNLMVERKEQLKAASGGPT